jgi:hypothetical protein
MADEEGRSDLRYRYRVNPGSSIMTWPLASRHVISYSLPINLAVPPGTYRLQATLVPKEDGPQELLTAELPQIRVLEKPSGVAPPAVHATFGSDLRLHGYNLETSDHAASVSLLWQSLQPMEVDYKFFVHLNDQSGSVVAQADVMPHDWAYPTSWWKPAEVVSDSITLSLDVPPGTYTLGIGVYNPYTGERLPITDHPPYLTVYKGRLILPQDIVR